MEIFCVFFSAIFAYVVGDAIPHHGIHWTYKGGHFSFSVSGLVFIEFTAQLFFLITSNCAFTDLDARCVKRRDVCATQILKNKNKVVEMKMGLLLFIHKDQIPLTAWCPGYWTNTSVNSWLTLVKTMKGPFGVQRSCC